jgi:signal recognition particle subunit SRP54
MVLIDTAGRLHVDDELMLELEQIKNQVKPHEILLVVDAMTGQDAVNVTEAFNSRLDVDGVILTKLDGDTRGGAALSIKAVTGKPIKFVGMGEKLDALEPFHPDRMASRILGMGDVLTLIEKAQAQIDEKKARELEEKIRKSEFTLEDFLDQFQQMKAMGPLDQLIGMIPGMNKIKGVQDMELNEKEMGKTEAIIRSMTPQERRKPEIINGSRRKRIAVGSGTSVQMVNRLLKQFVDMQKMMKQMNQMQSGKMMKKGNMAAPFFKKR